MMLVDLDEFGEAFARELGTWLSAHPDQKAVDRYYRVRLEQGNIYGADDRAVLRAVADGYPAGTKVVDLGCGYAQMGAALAASGYLVTGVEHDRVRRAGALAVRDALAGDFPGVERMAVASGTWPVAFPAFDYDVLIAGNVINSCWEQWAAPEGQKLPRTLRGRDAVLDVQRWWRERLAPVEQDALVDEICGLGYTAARVGGTIWHFRRIVAG